MNNKFVYIKTCPSRWSMVSPALVVSWPTLNHVRQTVSVNRSYHNLIHAVPYWYDEVSRSPVGLKVIVKKEAS